MQLLPSTCTPTPLNDTFTTVDERLKHWSLQSTARSKDTGSSFKARQVDEEDKSAPSSKRMPPVATIGCGASFTVAVTRKVATMASQNQQTAETDPSSHLTNDVMNSESLAIGSSFSEVEVWLWGALTPSIRSSAPRRIACFDLAPRRSHQSTADRMIRSSTMTRVLLTTTATNAAMERSGDNTAAAAAAVPCHSEEDANVLASQLQPISHSGSTSNITKQWPMAVLPRPQVTKVACGEAFFVLLLSPHGGRVRAGRKTTSTSLSSSLSSLSASDVKLTSPEATPDDGDRKAEDTGDRTSAVDANDHRNSLRQDGDCWSQLWGMGVLFEDSFGSGSKIRNQKLSPQHYYFWS